MFIIIIPGFAGRNRRKTGETFQVEIAGRSEQIWNWELQNAKESQDVRSA